jgi:hypothetical protein
MKFSAQARRKMVARTIEFLLTGVFDGDADAMYAAIEKFRTQQAAIREGHRKDGDKWRMIPRKTPISLDSLLLNLVTTLVTSLVGQFGGDTPDKLEAQLYRGLAANSLCRRRSSPLSGMVTWLGVTTS